MSLQNVAKIDFANLQNRFSDISKVALENFSAENSIVPE
jgi:hypothetical protein